MDAVKTCKTTTLVVITSVILGAILILSGCTRSIQAQELEKNLYSVEKERIIISIVGECGLSEKGDWINIASSDISSDIEEGLSRTLVIVCTGEEKFIVASQNNHKGWSLTYNDEEEIFVSSDGKRKFSLDGSVIGDKPKKPLKIHSYSIEDGRLLIDI